MESMRTNSSIKNVMYGMINKVVSLVLSLVSRYIFLYILPIEYLGINGVFADVLVMLSLADLGMATAMAYSFYKPLAEHDEEKLIALMTFYRKIYHAIAVMVTVVGLLAVPFLKYIIHVEQEIPHITLYYLISLFNTVVSYLFAYKQSIITADQKYYIISKYSMWIAFAKILFQTIALYISHSYTVYLCVGVATTICYNLLVNYQANKYYPFIMKESDLAIDEKRDIFSNIKSVFIYKVSNILMSGTDNTLISILVNTAAVGLYTNYLTVVNRIVQLSGVLFNSITASIGNLVVKETKEKSYQIFKLMQLCSIWIGGFIVIALYFLMEDFIRIWLGKEYVLSQYVLIAILCNVFYDIIKQPVLAFREATGMYKQVKYIMFICAIENIVLSVILGKIFGIAGIILASFVAKITTTFWYEAKLLFSNYFQLKLMDYFFQIISGTVFCILCGGLCGLVMKHIVVTNFIKWIFKGIICTVIINIVYLIRYGHNRELQTMVSRIINIYKR